jgi:hypothetical protein
MSTIIDGQEVPNVRLYIDSDRKPGLRFRVLSLDTTTQRGVLLGPMGVQFERVISKSELEKYGYKRVKEMDNAEQPQLQA